MRDDTAPPPARLAGAFNFRDLGGLRVGADHQVRPGLLFRSDTLQALTDADVETLVGSLGVELIVDLRGGLEAVDEGRGRLAALPVCYLNAPLRDAPASSLDPRAQTLHFYRHTLSSSAPLLTAVMQVTCAMAGRPIVVHCAAGKDRTGLVTALVLGLLGADHDEIVRDYLRTRHNMPRIIERFRGWPRYRNHMASVPPEIYQTDEYTIRAFLRGLDDAHGSAFDWAVSQGVPVPLIERLRRELLRPAR